MHLAESKEKNKRSPDYLWYKKLWEFKSPESKNGINKRMQLGVNQILENPGGLIIDMKKTFRGRIYKFWLKDGTI